jgi:hypothetical protein
MRTAGTIDTLANGSRGNCTSGLSTPTHSTQVCVTLWGADSVEAAASPAFPVHPSGQHTLSTLTSSVKAASVKAATIRSTLASIVPVGRCAGDLRRVTRRISRPVSAAFTATPARRLSGIDPPNGHGSVEEVRNHSLHTFRVAMMRGAPSCAAARCPWAKRGERGRGDGPERPAKSWLRMPRN